MGGDTHGEFHRTPSTCFFRQYERVVEGGVIARDDDLTGTVIVGDDQHPASFRSRLFADGAHRIDVQRQQRRHRARLLLARLFHQPTPLTHQPQSFLERQRTCGRQRREFAEAVSSGKSRRRIRAFTLQCAQSRHTAHIKRRLCVDRVVQVISGTVETQIREREAERIIRLLKSLSCSRVRFREIFPHADNL